MSDLPDLVRLDSRILDEHQLAHVRLHDELTAVNEPVRRAWWATSRRLLIEALANVQPTFVDVDAPLLLPPPRRFLGRLALQRVSGASAAFRHVDSALAMATMPGGRHVLQPSTPSVLNALLAGPVTERETNAGLVRVTPTNWMADANAFEHPPAERVNQLIDGAVVAARDGSESAVERAAWLAFMTMTIHPFVDGNGRTARALFLATVGTDLPGVIDWGVLDQWHLARKEYVRALQAGQQAERFDASNIDPGPFMRFAALSSARGADVALARLRLLAAAARDVVELNDRVLLRVAAERFVPIDDLVTGAPDVASTLDHLSDLVERGLASFKHASVGAPPDEVGARGVVIGERLADVVTRLRQTRFRRD